MSMNIDEIQKEILSRRGAVLEFPFGPEVMVFKVMKKIFALVAWQEDPLKISLKTHPERALQLREIYQSVKPGYHLNKRHWITVTLDGSIPDENIRDWVFHSYEMVVRGLKRSEKAILENIR